MLKRLSSCFHCYAAPKAYEAKVEEGGSIHEGRRLASKATVEEGSVVRVLTRGRIAQYDLSPTGVIVIANLTPGNGTERSLPLGGLLLAAASRVPVYFNASAARMLRLGSSSLSLDDSDRLDNTAAMLSILARLEPALTDKLNGLLHAPIAAGHQRNNDYLSSS
ncbi:hypothetical protein Vretimale_902, partial [Volvox reticuliferus]